MKVLIRADASLKIGFGHVMRCLTLADTLTAAGVICAFVCRTLPGNAIRTLENNGYQVFALDVRNDELQEDRRLTQMAIDAFGADWLLVDHYELDARWERELTMDGLRLLAIDDLANRPHEVDVLLDQNLGRSASDYDGLLADTCLTFIGPEYALLRPQFHQERSASRLRREAAPLHRLLISMGGTDNTNATGAILRCLRTHATVLSTMQSIAVVMGSQSVWLDDVRSQAEQMPIATEVLVGVDDMAAEMRRADLAIGAGGTTSWERCCLGLPSVVFCLADNQTEIAQELHGVGAAINIGRMESNEWQDLLISALARFQTRKATLREMSEQAFKVTDGLGAVRLCREIFNVNVDWDKP